MQREKTIDFWNDYHEQDDDKEWILRPSEQLLNRLISYFPIGNNNNSPSINILEIGCGTSQLARCLYEQQQQQQKRQQHSNNNTKFVVTDVSPVCIEINRTRDADILSDCFDYQLLNALEPALEPAASYHVILDKGCLDTFLFRSSQSQGSQLLTKLLDNVWNWLFDGGQYLVLTPRPRITVLRDYPGFSSVERVILDDSNATLGDLEDGQSMKNQVVYLHICTKHNSYQPGDDCLSDGVEEEIPQHCETCNLTLQDFRHNKSLAKDLRRWKGHRQHCHGG